jgi:hypothetical protein
VLKTNADGTATLARGALGALGTVFGVNGSSAITGVSLVTPALGTPASGVLTNCTGVPAAALPAGSVLQVVQGTYATQTTTGTNTFVDTGLTASITPSNSSNKILVVVSHPMCIKTTANGAVALRILRGATNIYSATGNGLYSGTAIDLYGGFSFSYLDSPSTASSTTYKTQFASNQNSGTVYVQGDSFTSTIILMEIQG